MEDSLVGVQVNRREVTAAYPPGSSHSTREALFVSLGVDDGKVEPQSKSLDAEAFAWFTEELNDGLLSVPRARFEGARRLLRGEAARRAPVRKAARVGPGRVAAAVRETDRGPPQRVGLRPGLPVASCHTSESRTPSALPKRTCAPCRQGSSVLGDKALPAHFKELAAEGVSGRHSRSRERSLPRPAVPHFSSCRLPGVP